MVLDLISHDIISTLPIGHLETYKDEEYFNSTLKKEIESPIYSGTTFCHR